jgi:hypothetical protein
MLRQKFTPEDFGLAVRKHPGALLITARNKMKSAQQISRTIGLAGRRLETTTLLSDHTHNREALNWLVETIDTGDAYDRSPNGWHRWRSIDRGIVAEFLERYGQWAAALDPIFSGTTLSNWVRSARASKFARWDIAVANGRPNAEIISLSGERELHAPQRVLRRDGDLYRVSGSRRRLGGPSDLAGMLDKDMRKKVEAEQKAQEPDKSLPERIYYPVLERPALIIYPLLSAAPDDDSEAEQQNRVVIGKDDYLVALKVAIPGDPTKVRDAEGDVTYVINTVAQQNWLSEFTGADDEDLDD